MTEGEYKEVRKRLAQTPERDVRDKKHCLVSLLYVLTDKVGRDSAVGIVTGYRAGRYWDRIPVGGEIFSTRPDRPWDQPSLLHNGIPGHSRG